jgi:hypothetical protein
LCTWPTGCGSAQFKGCRTWVLVGASTPSIMAIAFFAGVRFVFGYGTSGADVFFSDWVAVFLSFSPDRAAGVTFITPIGKTSKSLAQLGWATSGGYGIRAVLAGWGPYSRFAEASTIQPSNLIGLVCC